MSWFWWAVLVVMVVTWLRGRKRKRAQVPYRYTGMLLLVGIPGSGKTYKMVSLMVQRLAEGRHVRVNFNVRYDRIYRALRARHGLSDGEAKAALTRISYLDTFEDYLDAYDCDLFIDEAQDTLSSADWQLFPHEVVQFFAQHRHRLCRVVLASHRYGSIHNYVRELIGDIELARPAPWYVRALSMAGKRHVLQYVRIKDAEEGVTPQSGPSASKAKGRALLFSLSGLVLDPLIASCYDTHGGVRPSPMQSIRNRKRDGEVYVLQPREYRPDESRAVDGLPSLTTEEVVRALCARQSRADRLRARMEVAGVAVPA